MSQNLLHDFLNLYFLINKLGNKVQGCIKKSIFFAKKTILLLLRVMSCLFILIVKIWIKNFWTCLGINFCVLISLNLVKYKNKISSLSWANTSSKMEKDYELTANQKKKMMSFVEYVNSGNELRYKYIAMLERDYKPL